MASETVEMAQYGALLSHLVTMETRVPVQHFFDGFRTSHEVNKVKLLNYDTIKDLIDWDRVRQHHELALHPRHPHMSGGTRPPWSICRRSLSSSVGTQFDIVAVDHAPLATFAFAFSLPYCSLVDAPWFLLASPRPEQAAIDLQPRGRVRPRAPTSSSRPSRPGAKRRQ